MQLNKWYTQIAWEEVPHLGEKAKADLMASVPLYQKEARSKGIPTLGSGLIYPLPESEMRENDFKIPDHWRRAWALDTGWNWTACVWGAFDPEAKITHIYSVYKRGQAEPAVHAEAVRGRGKWIPGVGDAADINKKDGRQMIEIYREDYKLDIQLPVKAVEAGIYKVWCALTQGTMKVFASCSAWFDEVRFYARDEKGSIVKKNDHLMDATRYLLMNGMDRAIAVPVVQEDKQRFISPNTANQGWMAS